MLNIIFSIKNDNPYSLQSIKYFFEKTNLISTFQPYLSLKDCSKSFTKSSESLIKNNPGWNLKILEKESDNKFTLYIENGSVFTFDHTDLNWLKNYMVKMTKDSNLSKIILSDDDSISISRNDCKKIIKTFKSPQNLFFNFNSLDSQNKLKYFLNNFGGLFNINSHFPVLILHSGIESIIKFNLKHEFLLFLHFLVDNNLEEIKKFLVDFNPRCIVSLGEFDSKIFSNLTHIFTFNYCKKWIHFPDPSKVTCSNIEHCTTHSKLHKGIGDNPLISIITPTYESKKRILRPYHSLKSQTYTNWEWIILDDSKSDETWKTLTKFAEEDYRIKIFRRQKNNGSIGANKKDCAALSSGKFIFELDHDDDILEHTFDRILDSAKKYPDAGFFYSDFIECSENTLKPFRYGNYFGLGFGSYYRSWWKNDFHYMCRTPQVNMYTLRHIVGVPNHFRCWTKEAYISVGGYNEDLQVADDYDLILRTLFKYRWVHIPEMLYIQYRNDGGDNFTFHRNALIQYLVGKLRDVYENDIHQRVTSFGEYDFLYKNQWVESPLDYEVPFYQHPIMEHTYYHKNQDSKNPLISVIVIFNKDCAPILDIIFGQTYSNYEILMVGNGESEEEIDKFVKSYGKCKDPRFRYYNLYKKYGDLSTSYNYAIKRMCNSNWITYLQNCENWTEYTLEYFVENIRGNDEKVEMFVSANRDILHHIKVCHNSGLWENENKEEFIEKVEKDKLKNF